MKRIGIVGLGIMGSGMAENFLKNGFEVYVWNRSEGKTEKFAAKGAKLCQNPKEVAQNSEIVFEVTANDESSREVWTGEKGILEGASRKTILVSSSTLSVAWVDELSKTCLEKEFIFFDMALTGGRIGAETGNLTLLVGGDEQKLEDLKPTLQAIASKIFYFGPNGHGMRYKLLLNMLQAIHIVGFGEVMKIAVAEGMDLDKVSGALVDRPGGAMTTISRNNYHNQPDPITFSIEWITKDLEYAKRFAVDTDTPLLNDVLEKYKLALKSGKGQTDWTNINEI